MIIILLGEVVVSVGSSAAEVPDHGARYWLGLLGGLVLAAALWWIYFTAAAPISEYVLRASGGNPSMAYGLYAGGQLSPAFALLVMAAGMSLALSATAPRAAAWFITGGLAVYLAGSRAMVGHERGRSGPLVAALFVAATACLAFLEPLISVTGVVLVATAWACGIAAYVTRDLPARLRDVAADPLSYFHPLPPGEPQPADPANQRPRSRSPPSAPSPSLAPPAQSPAKPTEPGSPGRGRLARRVVVRNRAGHGTAPLPQTSLVPWPGHQGLGRRSGRGRLALSRRTGPPGGRRGRFPPTRRAGPR